MRCRGGLGSSASRQPSRPAGQQGVTNLTGHGAKNASASTAHLLFWSSFEKWSRSPSTPAPPDELLVGDELLSSCEPPPLTATSSDDGAILALP